MPSSPICQCNSPGSQPSAISSELFRFGRASTRTQAASVIDSNSPGTCSRTRSLTRLNSSPRRPGQRPPTHEQPTIAPSQAGSPAGPVGQGAAPRLGALEGEVGQQGRVAAPLRGGRGPLPLPAARLGREPVVQLAGGQERRRVGRDRVGAPRPGPAGPPARSSARGAAAPGRRRRRRTGPPSPGRRGPRSGRRRRRSGRTRSRGRPGPASASRW